MSLLTSAPQTYTVDDKKTISKSFQDFNRIVSTRSNYAPYTYLKNVSQYSYTTSGEKDMMSFSLKDNLISDNSQCIKVSNCGNFANNANNKRVRLLIGSTQIYDSGSSAFTNAWLLETEIILTGINGSNTTCITKAITSSGSTVTRTVTNIDWTIVQTIKTAGTGAANADILQDYQEVVLTNSR